MFAVVVKVLAVVGFASHIVMDSTTAARSSCKMSSPMDIRYSNGVQTDKISGSRIEYMPFPGGFMITPGSRMQIEFRSRASTGLIFLAGNFDVADMASAYLRKGRLTFARRCGSGSAFDVYHERLDDGRWHTLTYYHDEIGGSLRIDGVHPFRHYHIGPCTSFSSVMFGGMTIQDSRHMDYNREVDDVTEVRESELAARHRFFGCLRNLRFDGKVPVINPRYVAVSQCD